MIRAVLLDFYGTLVDEADESIAEICALVAARAQAAAGVDGAAAPSPAQVDEAWRGAFVDAIADSGGAGFRTLRAATEASLSAVLERFGVAGAPAGAAELCEIQAAYWRRPTIAPETRAFLAALSVPVCVVSNVDSADLRTALDHLELSFEHVVTSEDERSYKPEGRMFAAALTRLGLPAAQVLHVGDSLSADIGGGAAAGLPTAWVNRAGRANPGPHRPDHEVDDLTKLLPLFA